MWEHRQRREGRAGGRPHPQLQRRNRWNHRDSSSPKVLPQGDSISDLFTGDEVGSAPQLNVGKVQMFFSTLIVVLAYTISLRTILYRAGGLPAGLPDVSEGMVV